MKVWIIRDLEPISTDPGAPRLMRAGILSSKLAEMGHDTVWYTSSFNHYTRTQRPAGRFRLNDHLIVNVIYAPGYSKNISIKRIIHNIKFARDLQKKLISEPELPDIIVADLPTTEAASLAVKLGIKMNIPTIVTIRDLWPDFFANYVPAKLRPLARYGVYPLEKQATFACRYATSLIGISEMYLRWGQNKGREDTSLDNVFPLGYKPVPLVEHQNNQTIRDKFQVAQNKTIISFVGSWGKSYDIQLLAETANILRNRTDIVFVIAGDSSIQPKIEKKLNSLSNVVLAGWLDRHEVASLLRCSSVGILPYKSNAPQGLPNKIFEYMAYGAFQISTLSGEAKKLLEETGTGISVLPGSARELSKAIEKYLSEAPSPKSRSRIIKIFEERYSSEIIYNNYINHMKDVLAAHRNKTPYSSAV